MHNPYKAKLALLAASFVTASSLSACIPTINPAPVEEANTVEPEGVSPTTVTPTEPEEPEISVNPAPPPAPEPEPEISVNPAPPPS